MKLVCAWCKASMGDNGMDDGLVSHGVCVWCAKDLQTEIAKRLDEPLAEDETTH